jgi:surface antigen
MRWRLAAWVAIAVGAAVVLGTNAPSGLSRAAAAAPIIYGYPYASRCPGAGIAEVVDRWGMYACNCTSYVAWALSANGERTTWFIPGSMDAWNWPNVAHLSGLRVDKVPEVGAVVVWPKIARPFGHVAYVTALRPRGAIDVAEYNLRAVAGQRFGFDTRSWVRPRDALFIHVPKRDVSER